jgi:hypothetical protein
MLQTWRAASPSKDHASRTAKLSPSADRPAPPRADAAPSGGI